MLYKSLYPPWGGAGRGGQNNNQIKQLMFAEHLVPARHSVSSPSHQCQGAGAFYGPRGKALL